MYRTGHYGAALLAYAPVGAFALALGFDGLALAGGVVAVLGAKIPDIDRSIPGLAHRGLTHTVWFALLVGAIGGILGAVVGGTRGPLASGVFGATVGVVTIGSHVLADALTPIGVRPFVPVSDREYSLGITTAANPLANVGLFVLGVLATALAVLVGNALGELLG